MAKISFLTVCLLTLQCVLHAQEGNTKNIDIKSENSFITYKLYSKTPLTKDQSFAEVYPKTLNYSTPFAVSPKYSPILSMEAKVAKPNTPYKVKFIYNTKGIDKVIDNGNLVKNVTVNPSFPKYNIYKRISFTCPFELVIEDSLGSVLKSINIANSERYFSVQFDKNFLTPQPGVERLPELPFSSEAEANSYYETNKKAILAKFETSYLGGLYNETKLVIYNHYDFSKLNKETFWFFQMEKKTKETYPDLFEKTEAFEKLIDDFEKVELQQKVIEDFKSQYDFYKAKLNNGSLPWDVKQLCRYNGAVAAAFIGKVEESRISYGEFYNDFYLIFPWGISYLPTGFSNLYNFFNAYYAVKNNMDAKEFELSPSLDDIHYKRFLKDNKMNDPRIDALK